MSHPEPGTIPGTPPPPEVDSEAGQVRPVSNFRGVSNVKKWKNEDWINKGALALIFRSLALIFSLVTFLVVYFTKSYTISADIRYLLSISIIVMVYTTVLVGVKGHELWTGKVAIPHNVAVWIDFIGDQILSLLLLSSASSATSAVRFVQHLYEELSGIDLLGSLTSFLGQYTWILNKFIGSFLVMAFLGFFSLLFAALISAYHLVAHLLKK